MRAPEKQTPHAILWENPGCKDDRRPPWGQSLRGVLPVSVFSFVGD